MLKLTYQVKRGVKTMKKQKKNGNKLSTQKITLVTAILGLIKIMLEIIKELLE